MVEAEHVVAVDDLLGEDVVVGEVVGLCVGRALHHRELDALELLALDARALRDALLRVLEELALRCGWLANELPGTRSGRGTYLFDQEDEGYTVRFGDVLVEVVGPNQMLIFPQHCLFRRRRLHVELRVVVEI